MGPEIGAPPLPTITCLSPTKYSNVCVCPARSSVYGCWFMIDVLGVTPGAVFALEPSWRTTNVYVVGLASSASNHLAWVASQALAATKTSFAVHALVVEPMVSV